MKIGIQRISVKKLCNSRSLATVYMLIFCVQIVSIEGYGISPVKVGLMGIAPLIFVFKTPYVNKALLWGSAYWTMCYFSALLNGDMRFSTIGYLGMFIISFIVFYNLIYTGAFSFKYFVKLLRGLIIAYGVVLILQQISILVGLRSLWFINLSNQHFLSLTKLPSLTIEPSHSARLLTIMMLSYLRCVEIANEGIRPTLKQLFSDEHCIVIVLFLWTMLTMGSGTAFIGLGLLSLYFIHRKTALYTLPLFGILFYVGQSLELEQMDRAVKISQAVATTRTVEGIQEADGSGAVRIIPLINTFTKTDLTDKTTWVGHGTPEYDKLWWTRTDKKLGIIEQYGLLTFIISLILVYTCMIRSFFSIETLIFISMFGFSIGNFYYVWGTMMVFAAVRYFTIQYENGLCKY